jgi:tetratricopeptide (TPR) repeat protein
MKTRKYVLALALLAAAALVFFSMEMAAIRRAPGAGRRPSDNKYGLYLASFRAEISNDIFGLEEVYPAAVVENGVDFLGKSFVLRAQGGDAEGARRDAEDGLKRDKLSTLSAIYLVHGDFLRKDYAAALGRLDSLKTKSDAFLVKFVKSWALVGIGEKDAALDLLESEINNRAFEKIVLAHLALQAELTGEMAYADELYAEMMRFKPDLSDIENLAGFYIRSGHMEKALEAVSGFAAGLPSSVSALSLLKALENGYEPPPVDTPEKGLAKALFDVSNVLMRAFSFTDDLYLLYVNMALDLWPDFYMARLMQAELYRKYGRNDEYAAAVAAIPRKSYLRLVARLNYASHLALEGGRAAPGLYRDLVGEYPDFAAVYQGIGDYYRNAGSPGKAAKYYSKGLARASGKALSDLYFSRAISYDALGKDGDAMADFERALELDQKNPVVLNYYGYFLVAGGHDVEKGKKLVERAVYVDPMNPYYLDSYAWSLFKAGDLDSALRMEEYAKAFEPKNPVIMDHLGDIYWTIGRRREAVFEWRKAMSRIADGDVQKNVLDGLSEHKLGYKIEHGLGEE